MKWFLVTGAPCADIGKGSLCAALARKWHQCGQKIAYQKLEPCLQRSLDGVPSGAVGEIVRLADGRCVDFDVARVLFYAPHTKLGAKPDLSLWNCLNAGGQDKNNYAPRIVAETAAGLAKNIPSESELLLVEVGGTLGEAEHRILLNGLIHVLGLPYSHFVVGSVVCDASGRHTTKPLQICLSLSPVPADIVFVRGCGDIELKTLTNSTGNAIRFVRVNESANPVTAYMNTLDTTVIPDIQDGYVEPWCEMHPQRGVVMLRGDFLESRRYESLGLRIHCWSNGRINVVNERDGKKNICGVVIVDGGADDIALPILHISKHSVANRSDWMGTADNPCGPVAKFLSEVESALTCPQKSAYAIDGFAKAYIAQSRIGNLRDHSIMDPIVWEFLPAGDLVHSARILDIGCGYGRWPARLIDKNFAEVVGVEPSPQMCGALNVQKIPRFRLLQSRIEDAQIDGLFDAAIAMMSLDHVDDLSRVVRIIASHLKPAGRLIITTEHPWRTSSGHYRWRTHPTDASRRQGILDGYCEEGPRYFTWFGRPEPVVVQHRTIETWVRALRNAGFNILAIREPVSSDPKDGNNPRFWLLCAEIPALPSGK